MNSNIKNPSKLNAAFIRDFCALIRDGLCPKEAAAILRVHIKTIENWILSGRKDPSTICGEFVAAIESATVEGKHEALKRWKELNADTKDYRSLQAFLATVHKMTAPNKIEHTGSITVEHTEGPDLSKLTNEQLKQYLENEERNAAILAAAEEQID